MSGSVAVAADRWRHHRFHGVRPSLHRFLLFDWLFINFFLFVYCRRICWSTATVCTTSSINRITVAFRAKWDAPWASGAAASAALMTVASSSAGWTSPATPAAKWDSEIKKLVSPSIFLRILEHPGGSRRIPVQWDPLAWCGDSCATVTPSIATLTIVSQTWTVRFHSRFVVSVSV